MIENISKFVVHTFFFFLPKGHPWDYLEHFIVSLAGVCILSLMLLWPLKMLGVSPRLAIFTAVGLMLALGIVKEINDIRLGKKDVTGDLTSDILGLAAGMLIIFLIMKAIK